MLSPFTWWNDTFINLPLAYITANILNKTFPRGFLCAFLAAYWLTNLVGIILMYVGARGLAPRGLIKDKFHVILITIALYSIIFGFLIKLGIIRPFS
jgi:hypothetical protein